MPLPSPFLSLPTHLPPLGRHSREVGIRVRLLGPRAGHGFVVLLDCRDPLLRGRENTHRPDDHTPTDLGLHTGPSSMPQLVSTHQDGWLLYKHGIALFPDFSATMRGEGLAHHVNVCLARHQSTEEKRGPNWGMTVF